MANCHATGEALIPRFVRNLNAIAERCGMRTSVSIGQIPQEWRIPSESLGDYSWARGDVVLSFWEGSVAELHSTNLLLPSYRIPLSVGWISFPTTSIHRVGIERPVAAGFVHVSGKSARVELYCGPLPLGLSEVGGVQVIDYAEALAYHGEGRALVNGGICTARQIPGKNPSRQEKDDPALRHWFTRRQPDGTYVHYVEQDDVYIARMALERDRLVDYASQFGRSDATIEAMIGDLEDQSLTDEMRRLKEQLIHGKRYNKKLLEKAKAIDAFVQAKADPAFQKLLRSAFGQGPEHGTA